MTLRRTNDSSGRGAAFEWLLASNHIFQNGTINRKIIPVGFGPHDLRIVPTVLQPYLYFDVTDHARFEDLLLRLQERAPIEPIALGALGDELAPARITGVPAEFRGDVVRLLRASARAFNSRIDRQSFDLEGARIHFQRDALFKALLDAAKGGSLLVTGEPGAGKSAVLHRLVADLQSESDLIFFDVEREEVSTPHALRTSLGLHHEIDDVLSNWPGTKPAFFIVDALDALRSSPASKAYRDLLARIATKASRWHVIVAIRSYDLGNSPTLRQLFRHVPGNDVPSDFQEPSHAAARHIRVDRLSLDELADLAVTSTRFRNLVTTGSEKLLSVIRNPFNLSLAASVLNSGARVEALRHVDSKIGLLDLYWQHRILELKNSDQLEIRLRMIVEDMVAKRSLIVSRLEHATDAGLETLLQQGVIIERADHGTTDRYRIGFAHALLFDYAVQRLVLRQQEHLGRYLSKTVMQRSSCNRVCGCTFDISGRCQRTVVRFGNLSGTLRPILASHSSSMQLLRPSPLRNRLFRAILSTSWSETMSRRTRLCIMWCGRSPPDVRPFCRRV